MTPQDLQLDWLKSFVAVIDTGSLSQAAVEVHRSQSAVSMQIKKLESAVGRPLLVRNARHLQLTHEGQTLLGYARRMLFIHAEAQAAFQGESIRGRVRLGVAEDYAAKYLTPVLKRFAPQHPSIEIELDCEQSTVLIPRIAEGQLDLALVSSDQSQRGSVLFREPMLWVGSPEFELWNRNPLPVAVYEPASLARRSAINSLASQGRCYKVVYNSSSLTGQITAVESGLAIAALTRCSVPASLQILGMDHGLGLLEPMEVAVYRSKASQCSMAVTLLKDFLTKVLRSFS